ncbi:TonB-dependent receptor [Catalinimonas sp. 4WD22]|uniref:TonB-dependent receptor n=1 Tax=Catalinimonas locisalis TaxID=3133978 RepID=UPI00310127C7
MIPKRSNHQFVSKALCLLLMLLTLPFLGFSALPEAYENEEKITLIEQGISLKSVMDKISEQTSYHFAYDEQLIDINKLLSIKVKNASLDKVLEIIAQQHPLAFKKIGRTIHMMPVRQSKVVSDEIQLISVTGTVTSDGEAIPGVNVLVKGTSTGTITDVAGKYSINVPNEDDILVFSSIGFLTQEIPVNGRSTIDVALEEDVQSLEEVVVIGYGTMEKEKLVTPVSSVNPELVQKEVTNSLDRALEGKIAGMSVKQGSGAPGGGSEIRIRGAGSIGADSQPLIVIDGVPMQMGYNKERSPLSLLNQSDISSIDVLKGAAATAIYGSRGSNGVILVTTKRGKEGRTDFTFSASTGWDQVLPSAKLDLMNAEEFARWRKENAYESAAFYGEEITDEDIPEVYRNPELLGEGTDWHDVITQIGRRQDYNLSVSHGAEDFTGFFSLGYLDQTGTVKNTSFERLSFRANMGYSPNDIVKIELNINPTIRTWNNQIGGNRTTLYGQNAISTPIDGPYREDGVWERDNDAYYDGDWDLDIWSPGTFSNNNALYALEHQYDKTRNLNLLVTPALEVKPFESLTLRTHYNARIEQNNREFFSPSTITNIFNPPPAQATGYYNTDQAFNWQWENTANYAKTFGSHSVSALAGISMERYNQSFSELNGSNYPRDDIRTINAAIEQTGLSGESNWSMMSYFLRANYDYEGKYLLTASVRRDGSSRFGSDNRWATFPAIAAGWNISKEAFFPQTNWLTNLKLRGGYGTSGNNLIGNYTWIPTLTQSNYTFGGTVVDGLQVSAIENTELGWELATEYSAGLDILLWDGRVSLDIDYYRRLTENMLWEVTVPISSGFNEIQDNIGEIENEGLEFSLNTSNIARPDFSWKTLFNISFNRNEVLSLGDVDRIFAGWKDYSLTVPGQPMAMFFGWEQIGILQDAEDVANSATFPGQLPGTVKYRDLDGDGVITNDDRTFIGNPYPAFRGGLVNTLSYQNFDLSVALSFAHDFDVYSQLEGDVLNLDGVFNVLKIVEERWRSPEEPGNGEIPTSIHQTFHSRIPNTKMVNNASFLKAQNITLGYTLDAVKFLKSFRVFASVQNAFLLTNYKYGNPDVNRSSGGPGASSLERNFHGYDYPISRTFSIGLDLTF